MATSKRRRGRDAAGEDLDEALVDDEALDSVDDALDDDSADEEPVTKSRRGGTAVKTRNKVDLEAEDKALKARSEERVGVIGRLFRFFREVVAELRKVIWPTRKELLTYTTVVIVFVAIMLTVVASLDAAFAWAVLKVFGGKK